MAEKFKVSIIIVKYKSEPYLPGCLASLGKNPDYQVIVVDNDQQNIGYGAGCNKGAQQAKGKYLFFLNPDTVVFPGTVERLINFLDQNQKAGIVAPVLLDEKRKYYPLQVGKLTPFTGIVALSFFNKYFPNNSISQHYWLKDFSQKEPREVETFPGTAFLIRRSVFDQVGGFDPRIFLFFEEMDLSLRIRERSFQIFLEPQAKIIHFGEKSTTQNETTKKIFYQSRFYYFKKHWGAMKAIIVESFLRSGEWLARLF